MLFRRLSFLRSSWFSCYFFVFFSALFDWLRQNIWQHGSRFTTSQLIQQATGEDLNSRYFREHLT
ncbi:hypothetical protein, partial [Klebsiella pneumoniae]|uniref:hypothetical protein n=1 Tax=Klebsiella pneumoniae TaxID=573 RepID=UPI001D0DB5F6